MSYDTREKEVLEALEKSDHNAGAKEAMKGMLASYFDQRDGRLANLLECLEPGDDPCHGRWIDKARKAAAGAHDAIGHAEQGKFWLAKISNEEYTFFYTLMKSHVPAKRDLMVRQTKALAKAEKEFEEKWNVIREGDNALDERMEEIARQYGEILNSAARGAAIAEQEAREAMANKVKVALGALLMNFNFGPIKYVLNGATTLIAAKLNEVESRKLEIHALISRDEGIFGTFKETRQMVKEFLDETSYPRVKEAYDAAEQAAEALAGQMLTDGQKEDAEAFCEAIKDELEAVFHKAEDAYKSFARKHQYLFFGPLGDGYYQELMEDDIWKQYSRNWQESKADIDDLLRARTLEASEDTILEVSLDGLAAKDKRMIYGTLNTSCRDLLRVWNRFKEMTNDPEWALESRETLKSVLDAMR